VTSAALVFLLAEEAGQSTVLRPGAKVVVDAVSPWGESAARPAVFEGGAGHPDHLKKNPCLEMLMSKTVPP
jgi:hypothetical protein